MAQAVRCDYCGGWSRVADGATGATVACPHCARTFTARPAAPARRPAEPDTTPVVYPRKSAPQADGPPPLLVGLCLVPLAVPFVWLLLPLLTGARPIFTFALPTAVAVGVCGLCFGVAHADNWSAGTRLRVILLLLVLGYGSAALAYAVKKEWAQALRKPFGPPAGGWKKFSPPDNTYRAYLPGTPAAADESPLPGWPLAAFRVAAGPENDPLLGLAYEVAHGPAAEAVRPRATPDEAWFAAAKQALVEKTGGVVTAEEATEQQKKFPARDYTLTLPDGATTRLVRVVRVNRQAFYLAVEGAFIANDHRFVSEFFKNSAVTPTGE
jgi:hypothetical protein